MQFPSLIDLKDDSMVLTIENPSEADLMFFDRVYRSVCHYEA